MYIQCSQYMSELNFVWTWVRIGLSTIPATNLHFAIATNGSHWLEQEIQC